MSRHDAFNRALAIVCAETPRPAAKGMHTCASCLGALISPPFIYLAVETRGRKGPPEQSRLDAEQVGFHGACHEAWYDDLRQRAYAIIADSDRVEVAA